MKPTDPILDVLRIEIHHAGGVEAFDPNSLIIRIFDAPPTSQSWPALDKTSIISGEPAVVYKTHEVEVPLTVDEIVRLTTRSLTPVEFFVLLNETGGFFEIHGDFYNQTSGFALQPKA